MEEICSQKYCCCSGKVFVVLYLCKFSYYLSLISSCVVVTPLVVILEAKVQLVTSDQLLCSAFFLCVVLYHCTLLASLDIHDFSFSSVETSILSVASSFPVSAMISYWLMINTVVLVQEKVCIGVLSEIPLLVGKLKFVILLTDF